MDNGHIGEYGGRDDSDCKVFAKDVGMRVLRTKIKNSCRTDSLPKHEQDSRKEDET
jgi:hypothetical protein